MLISFVAVYLVGRLSAIYSSAAKEQLSINDRFHCVVGRLLGYKASFDVLAPNGGFSRDDLEQYMKKILAEEQNEGTLDQKDISEMTDILMAEMDLAGNGTVLLTEFLTACNANEQVKMKDLAKCFDRNHKAECLESLLSDMNPAKAVRMRA